MSLNLTDTGKTVGGRAVFRLNLDLIYDFEVKGLRLVVPAGFETDFHSVPRLLWPIFPPTGKGRIAAVIHDYLYSEEANCCRFLADSIYRDILGHFQVSTWRRVCMYYGVRLGGRWAYRHK